MLVIPDDDHDRLLSHLRIDVWVAGPAISPGHKKNPSWAAHVKFTEQRPRSGASFKLRSRTAHVHRLARSEEPKRRNIRMLLRTPAATPANIAGTAAGPEFLRSGRRRKNAFTFSFPEYGHDHNCWARHPGG